MMNSVVIDNATYKIMKYLYGKRGVKLHEIRERFGDDAISLICELFHGNYIVIRKPDGTYVDNTSALSYDFEACLVVPGNKYVEDRRESNVIRITPIFVSIVSVVVSIVSLIISIASNNSEIFVHIVK